MKSWRALFSRLVLLIAVLLLGAVPTATAVSAGDLFNAGTEAYRAGRFEDAAKAFEFSAARLPASGTLLNLGNAEWQRGRGGEAILAWERAHWLNPQERATTGNLQFARKTMQLESPRLTWYEVASTWLPANWWAWVTGLSLWLAVASAMLPGILRKRRASWHQALAACLLAIFLLSLPAQAGIYTRGRIGIVLEKEAPLRLTPTTDAQWLSRMSAGEPVRAGRTRGKYMFVETNRGAGWLEREQVGMISPADGRVASSHRETEKPADQAE